MNTMVHIHLLKTVSFIFICSTSIRSQSLYENDIQSYHILDGESKESSVQSLLNATQANFKKKVLTLEECNGRYNSIVDEYKHLLEMSRKGLIPNGTFLMLFDTLHFYLVPIKCLNAIYEKVNSKIIFLFISS